MAIAMVVWAAQAQRGQAAAETAVQESRAERKQAAWATGVLATRVEREETGAMAAGRATWARRGRAAAAASVRGLQRERGRVALEAGVRAVRTKQGQVAAVATGKASREEANRMRWLLGTCPFYGRTGGEVLQSLYASGASTLPATVRPRELGADGAVFKLPPGGRLSPVTRRVRVGLSVP